MDKVRWGLLSTARINRRLIPAIRTSQRGEMVAVASRSADHAAAYAAEWSIPRSFGSYEAMLDSDEIDAVYISLPNKMHSEWSIRALEAGKHVLCEKPFATSVEAADAMIAASQRTGRVLAEAFMYRHHPQTKLLGEWVRSGKLGEINIVRSVFSFYLGDRAGNVRLAADLDGGALWDVGIYPISLVLYLLGTPQTVTGHQWVGETGVDETFVGQFHYANGAAAQISASFRVPFQTSAEVHGTQGRIAMDQPFSRVETGKIWFTPPEGDPEQVFVPVTDLYLGEVNDLHAAILDGAPTLISLEESRNHVRMACTLYQSARSGHTEPWG